MNKGGRPPKLTREEAEHMRLIHTLGHPPRVLANLWKISETSVRRYLKGECRQHQHV